MCELGGDVVEHAVEQHPQPAPVSLGDQVVEVGLVAEARIDAVVVGGVVAMGAGREHGAERDTGRAQFDGVVEPLDDPAQSVLVGGGRWIGREGADEAERVDLPPDRVLDPARFIADERSRGDPVTAGTSLRTGLSWRRTARGAGPSTVTPGATVLIGSGATGGGGAPHSTSH